MLTHLPAREERLRRQDCSGAVGTYTQQCVLYGVNCECAQDGTQPCDAAGSGCPSGGGGQGGSGGSIPTDPGAGSCPDCGTGQAGGSHNVGPGTGGDDGGDGGDD